MINIEENINKIINGNVLDTLKTIPDQSINCIVTSPPYYQLRKYAGNQDYIWDGDNNCEHDWMQRIRKPVGGKGTNANVGANRNSEANMRDGNVISNVCSKCGAWKGQLGLEPTYQLYLQHLMQVMTECKRILRNDGTIWINLGDSYSTQGGTNTGIAKKDYKSTYLTNIMSGVKLIKPKDLPNKSLIGIPQRFVLKCVDELKLIWRNDIPWIKENGMPESVIDRFSKKHEYFYFLTKTTKYYFDLNSIRDTTKLQSIKRAKGIYNGSYSNSERTAISPKLEYGNPERFCNPLGKNPGDVPLFWDGQKKLSLEEYIELAIEYYYSQGDYFNIMTKSNSEKHYATYNEELIYKPIIAGCPENGIVLDPFNGIGTTCVVAKKHNRNYIGIDISDEYCKIAEKRLSKLNIDENYLKIKNKQKINNFI